MNGGAVRLAHEAPIRIAAAVHVGGNDDQLAEAGLSESFRHLKHVGIAPPIRSSGGGVTDSAPRISCHTALVNARRAGAA